MVKDINVVERMPGMGVTEFNDYLKEQARELIDSANAKDIGLAYESKTEVDKLCADLVAVLQGYELPNGEEYNDESRLLIINRAVGYLHIIVGRWFFEVCAQGAILRRVDHDALVKHWKEIADENRSLKDQLAKKVLRKTTKKVSKKKARKR